MSKWLLIAMALAAAELWAGQVQAQQDRRPLPASTRPTARYTGNQIKGAIR